MQFFLLFISCVCDAIIARGIYLLRDSFAAFFAHDDVFVVDAKVCNINNA